MSAIASTGLYVHVPFCARACPYCDFDFVVDAAPAIDPFLAGLEREVAGRVDAERRHDIDAERRYATVYVGGGTPSVLHPADLRRLVAWIRDRFDVADAIEWTVECNPEHVDAARIEALVESGIDRISLGVQSLEQRGLVQLGRAHTPASALDAIARAARAGLRVGADLIVGWPGQDPTAVARDVDALVDAGIEHVSIYALTIEPGTPWPKLVARGARAMPDPDAQADALLQAEAALTLRGFHHYEVASYARTESARSQHNLGYWTGRDYVGLGPSAASARAHAGGTARRTNPRGLTAWLAAPPEEEILDPERAAAEGLWLGLRVLTGMSISAFVARFPAASREWIEAHTAKHRELGNLVLEDDTLRVAPDRWLHHDAIASDLLLPVENG